MATSISTLETLPDELLLEVCKYLLNVDVLYSFFDLNTRMTSLIRDYRQHVSLHKGSFRQCVHIYNNIFPKIGSHIRTLVIDRLYSVLQDDMFYQHYNDQQLSNMFPELEEITFVAFRYDSLLSLLNMLNGFHHLVKLNLQNLFSVPIEYQSTVFNALCTANNAKINSIMISDTWDSFYLDNLSNVCYSNILNLRINLNTLSDLASHLAVIPNIRQLDVMLNENDSFVIFCDEISCLMHLTKFRLISIKRSWVMDDLTTILERMPNLEYLSLQLVTHDIRLTNGEEVRSFLKQLLPHVRQFNYGIYFVIEKEIFDCETLLASWSVFEIECLVSNIKDRDDIIAYIYTLPPYTESFPSVSLSGSIVSKPNAAQSTRIQINKLYIDNISNFVDCLPSIMCWFRMNELTINFSKAPPSTTTVTVEKQQPQQQQQQQKLTIPRMVRLRHLTLVGSVPSDFDHLSLIFLATPNLIRLDFSFDHLLLLFGNEELTRFCQQRITALSIYGHSSSSLSYLDEQHILRLASTFPRLHHLYVDLTYILSSIDSIVLSILSAFNKHLVSLRADGTPSEGMKTNARKWLQQNNNNNVYPTDFDASFNVESNRLLVWM